MELTAEVKVEDGASLALLTSVTPNLGYQKPGRFKSLLYDNVNSTVMCDQTNFFIFCLL